MKVLIGEDDPSQRDSLAEIARACGHMVVTCENGRAALAALNWFVPDVILLDLDMPEMGGMEAASRIRDRYARAQWNVVAYTGCQTTEARIAASRSGFTHYFVKPDDIHDVIALFCDPV